MEASSRKPRRLRTSSRVAGVCVAMPRRLRGALRERAEKSGLARRARGVTSEPLEFRPAALRLAREVTDAPPLELH
eukprot:6564338-Alexandrium_andersonii.AAC.1